MLLCSEVGMKKEDYMFCIGYQGDTALVDGQAKKAYGRKSLTELLELGLFRAALCATVYDDDQEGVARIIETYNRVSGSSLEKREDAMRLWGVAPVSDTVEKTLIIK
jgi:uncharacterized phage-associated protein